MEKRNKIYSLGLVVAAITALTGITMVSASAMPNRDQAHFAEMKTNQEKMQTVMDNKDYTAWKVLMQEKLANSPVAKTMNVVNESNFSKFVEMHNLRQAGKITEANVIRKELGLPEKGEGRGMGFGRGMHGKSLVGNK